MTAWQRRVGRFLCDRFGHRDRPYSDAGVFWCARCDRLLRPRPDAHADYKGTMAYQPNGKWSLQGPQPMWVGWRMQIAECECGRQFTNYGAYMWHWHVENRRRHERS